MFQQGVLSFIEKILFSKNRDMFTVRLGSALLLAKLGIVGFPATILSRLLRGVLGLFIEFAIFKIDLLLDAIKEGRKLKEFEEIAERVYRETTAKVFDEAKKNEIRKQYLEIISKIGVVGDSPNP